MILNTNNLVSLQEAKAYLGCSYTALAQWRSTGKIPGFKLGRNYFYRISDLDAFIKKGGLVNLEKRKTMNYKKRPWINPEQNIGEIK